MQPGFIASGFLGRIGSAAEAVLKAGDPISSSVTKKNGAFLFVRSWLLGTIKLKCDRGGVSFSPASAFDAIR